MRETSRDLKRRSFLKMAGAGSVIGVAGCIGVDDNGEDPEPDPSDDDDDDDHDDYDDDDDHDDDDDGDEEAETIRYVLNPAESDADIVAEYTPMFEYLEDEVGVEIEPQPVADYTATLDALRHGQAEIADASPSAAIAGEDVVDVVGIRIAFGTDMYFATITAEPDSGVEELSDLEGELISFSDNLSVSGALYPLFMLSEAGLDIGEAPLGDATDFDADYSDHATARENLINRDDVMAAGTGEFVIVDHVPADQFSDQFHDQMPHYADDFGTEEPELSLIGESDPIPNAPIVARSDWDDPVRADLEQALLDAEEEDLVPDPDSDDALWFTGVEPGESDDLDPIRNVMDTVGLEFDEIE